MKKSSYLIKAYVELTNVNDNGIYYEHEIVKVQVLSENQLNATLQAIRCIDENIEFILQRKVRRHEIKRIIRCEKIKEGGR